MVEKFNMPWEDRPAGCTDVMWRYSKNPVIGRYQIPRQTVYSTAQLFRIKTDLQEFSVATTKLYR